MAADDDVYLLVAELLLGVLLDDLAADTLRGVRIHPERLQAEPTSDRPPDEPGLADRDPVEVVEPRDLVPFAHPLAFLSASSTTGSIRSIPSTRSSRFSLPAQSAKACASSPSNPTFARRERISPASVPSTSIQSSGGVTPKSS